MESITYPSIPNIRSHQRLRNQVSAQKGLFDEPETAQTTASIPEAQGHNVSAFPEYSLIDLTDEDTLGIPEGYLVRNELSLPEDENTLFDDGLGPAEWNTISSMKPDNDLSEMTTGHGVCFMKAEEADPVFVRDQNEYSDAISLCTDPASEEEHEAPLCLPDTLSSMKHENDLSEVATGHSISCVEAEEADPVFVRDQNEYSDAISLCTDPPSEEEHEAPLGLPVLPGLLPHASKGTPQIFAPEATVSDWLSDFIDIPTSRADLEAKAADWSSIVDQVDFELEDCHDFITLELGIRMQLPMKYELTQGIEEVYRKLNHRYGFVDLSKALAVFHDIMQFQDVDLVHGDESPQWNSWRGEYGRKIKTSASLIANAKTHLQRYNNPVSPGNTDNLISIAAVAEGVQGPDVNLHYLSQDLRTIPNSSAGEHCATQPDPKVIRPRGFGLKSAKNARKQRYKAEVEVPGSVNRTKEMANAEFVKKMKPIRYISHQRKVANFLSANAYRPVTEAQQAKQAQIKEITPWEDFEHEAPTFQDSVNPPCDQSSGAPAGPPVRGSGIVRGLVALKKSMSNISLKSSRTKNSRTVTVQSQQVAVAEDSGTGLGSGPPLATVEEENTTFRTPTPTLAPNFVERTTQLDSRVHYRTPEEHTAALKGRAGHEASGINQRYFQFAVTTPAVKKRVKSLGMQNETGSIKTSAHHGVKTGIDPQNSPLSSPLPESITVLPESNSTDHIQFRDSSILNPMQSSNSNTGNRGQDGNPSSDEDSDDTVVPVHRCRRPRPTPWPPGSNITDHIELSESTITHGRRAADKVQDKDSDDTVEPADRRLTPLLPELTFPLLNSTNNMQSPEKTILHRRRIFRPVPDDDFDDSSFFAPRPRVDVAQRNREYGLHVPGEAQVQLRPRRAPDPMTPSQEMMENVRPCQVEGQFDPEEFGLGPRRRPENVVVTQHKVKQVYIQQPHLWTPKTSEINF